MPPIAAKVLMTVGLLVASLWIGEWVTLYSYYSSNRRGGGSGLQWFLISTGVTWLLVMLSTGVVWCRRLTLRSAGAQKQVLLFVAFLLIIGALGALPRVIPGMTFWSFIDPGYYQLIPIGWFIFACWIAGSSPPGSLGRVRGLSGAVVRCSKCKYDMTGQHSAVCPECGTKHTIGEVWRCGAATGLDAAAMDDDSPARDGPGSS